jgi:hypothetical protein
MTGQRPGHHDGPTSHTDAGNDGGPLLTKTPRKHARDSAALDAQWQNPWGICPGGATPPPYFGGVAPPGPAAALPREKQCANADQQRAPNRVRSVVRHRCRLQKPNADAPVLYARFIEDCEEFLLDQQSKPCS